MARTQSNDELALGSVCPPFELQDTRTQRGLGRDDIFNGSGLLVAFLSVHCPFVHHMERALGTLTAEYADRIATVAICSNDIANFPQDAPAHMAEQAARLGWCFPYLFDESQEVAREFHAACTPDLYLFDSELRLTYHGQFDETRPYRKSDADSGLPQHPTIHVQAHGADLRRAMEAMLAGEPPLAEQHPGLGCNIKWRTA